MGEWRPVEGSSYAALVITNGDVIDLSARNRFGLKVWAPKPAICCSKSRAARGRKEIAVPMTETNKWVECSVDFSDQIGKGIPDW
ncbi:MAG: hypothetical protein IPM81_16575 [Saprospirales bacterium]|nr:hypothetical protein [Saprospirales bacterium]